MNHSPNGSHAMRVTATMRMKKPPHPGRIVRQECIEPLGLTVTEAAERLGVTRQALNNHREREGRRSPPEMSIRLSKAFGGSPSGMAWTADGL